MTGAGEKSREGCQCRRYCGVRVGSSVHEVGLEGDGANVERV